MGLVALHNQSECNVIERHERTLKPVIDACFQASHDTRSGHAERPEITNM